MTVVAGAVVATVATAGLAAPVVTAPALSGMVAGSASAASAAAATATATATASTAGASTSLIAGIASGPVGWLVVGAEPHSSTDAAGVTFDCWKPVVRDYSTQLSSGKLLKEIITDERIKEIIIGECRNEFNLPELSLVNIWDEQFDINYLVLPYNNQLVAHAIRVMA